MVTAIHRKLCGSKSASSVSDSKDPPEPVCPDPVPAKAPREKHNLFTHFPKDPNCLKMQACES